MLKPAAVSSEALVGRSVPRLEDPPLLLGQGRYVGDMSFPQQLHMRVVRSPYAYARILNIDIEAAARAPGVIAIWTNGDIADLPPIFPRGDRIEKLEPYYQPILAGNFLRYVGEPFAAIFAEDPYLAEDAADLVTIEVEELPPVLAADAGPTDYSPGHSTEAAVVRVGYGEVDEAFARAHAVVELDLNVGRHSGVPLETRGAIGRYDKAQDIMELHGAAKVPHRNREHLARYFDRPINSVQLHEGHVGGGFGVRGELYPEDILVMIAAKRLGRPVKWIEDRFEHLIAANHARDQHFLIRAAVDEQGLLLAIDNTFFHDQGAYVRTVEKRVVEVTCAIVPGPYRLPAYRAAGHFRMTNKTPGGTYRSPGFFEGTFARERLLDAVAARLGIDPLELRRRNLIPPSQMPYEMPLPVGNLNIRYDSGRYQELLDQTLDRVGWLELQAELKVRRAAGEMVGAGVAIYIEWGGDGPRDGVRIAVDATGSVEVVTGGASIGQGFETVMAQVCAETLGAEYSRIRVIHGHTDRIPFGIGAHAARATVMTGSATRVAALKLRAKALDMAAQLMQSSPERLDIRDGVVFHKENPAGSTLTLAEIAGHLAPTSATLGEREPGLDAEGWFVTTNKVYPYGVHVAVVRVDRETGAATVERFLASHDIGRAINPMLCEAQIVGGVVQGIGGSLMEEFRYDERGQPLSASFMDYLMPTMREMPKIDVLLTEDAPSPLNPLGMKGVGEAGVTGVGAAIAAAIDNAIGFPGAITCLPVTPQNLRALLVGETNLAK